MKSRFFSALAVAVFMIIGLCAALMPTSKQTQAQTEAPSTLDWVLNDSPTVAGEMVTLEAQVTGEYSHVRWNFGDGSERINTKSPSQPVTVTHIYEQPGIYNAEATLYRVYDPYDPYGSPEAIKTLSTRIIIEEQPKRLAVRCNGPALVGARVTCRVFVPSDIDYETIDWDFDDGQTAEGTSDLKVTHAYDTTGMYVVKATLNPSGQSVSTIVDIVDKLPEIIPDAPDTREEALNISITVGIETRITGSLSNPGDQDWFSITIQAGVTYRIQTQNLSIGSDTIIYIYNEQGVLVAIDNNGGSGLGSFLILNGDGSLPSGTYYIKIIQTGGDGDSSFTYDLVIDEVELLPDLSISKDMLGGNPVLGNGELHYFISYSNRRGADVATAYQVRIVETLPQGVTYVSDKHTPSSRNVQMEQSGQSITWTIASLRPGERGRIKLRVKLDDTVTVGTVLEGTITIESDSGDQDTDDNTVTTTNTVEEKVEDVAIWKYASPMVFAGEMMNYYIAFWNSGNVTLSDVQVEDMLPENMELVRAWAWPPRVGGEVDGNNVTLNVDSLAPKQMGYLTIRANVSDTASGDVDNTATVEVAGDRNADNNSASATTTIIQTSHITGTVTGPDGEPVSRARVTAYGKNRGGHWRPVATDRTHSDGSYDIELESGIYIVRFSKTLRYEDRSYHFSEYYENERTRQKATPLFVAEGQTITNIDAQFDPPAPPMAEIDFGDDDRIQSRVHPRTGEVSIRVRGDARQSTFTIARQVCELGVEVHGEVSLQVVSSIGRSLGTYTMYSSSVYGDIYGAYGVGYYVTDVALDIQWNETVYVSVHANCGGVMQEILVGDIQLYDPSGYVTDAITGEPVEDATVDLFKVPDWRARTGPSDVAPQTCESNLSKDPDAEWSQPAPEDFGLIADPESGEMDPAENPLQTDGEGYYGWDVAEGCWYIEVAKEGYATKVSPVVGVPPEVTDLDIELMPFQTYFSDATYRVDETSGTATISVMLTAESDETVSVDYTSSDDTATADSDYTATSGTLTFAPGITRTTFIVPITDDQDKEGDETITLTLSNPENTSLGTPAEATLIIVDDDIPHPTVQFGSASYNVAETAGVVTIDATLSQAPEFPVTVAYATSDDTATASDDYTPVSGTLTFEVGETTQSFDISILDDEVVEEDETVLLTLADAMNADLGERASATLTIDDNDLSLEDVPNQVFLPLISLSKASSPSAPTETPVPTTPTPTTPAPTTPTPTTPAPTTPTLTPTPTTPTPTTPTAPTTPGKSDLVGTINLIPDKRTFSAGEDVAIEVVVTNNGTAATTKGFWVDVYINPSKVPTTDGTLWYNVCGMEPCFGLTWAVRQALQPGESITLTEDDLEGEYTLWPGWFANGTSDLYVYVDSWGKDGAQGGAVAESSESNNMDALHGLSVTGRNPDTSQLVLMPGPRGSLAIGE